MHALSDFEAHAARVLDENAWGNFSSGADEEQTLRDNARAFQRYRLRPRLLRDVSHVDMRTELFGETVAMPILVAPTAMQRMAHPEGEVAVARACAKLGTCMTLSSWATTSMEDVAEASGRGLCWFQLYCLRDVALTEQLVHRAETAGYKAVVITVDTPIVGCRLADTRSGFNLPRHLTLPNFASLKPQAVLVEGSGGSALHRYSSSLMDPSITWATVDCLRGLTDLPILLKGILTAEDAEEACRHNVQGIIVSNHGGRQLDGVPATIDVLGEVVRAVGGRVEVLMDGGVRHGTDVLKALALGARAVLVGRPVLWGLAYKGCEGVEEVLALLKGELELAMKLSGCASLSDITPAMVVHERELPLARL